jgi:hypothetical protein
VIKNIEVDHKACDIDEAVLAAPPVWWK